MIPTLHIHLLGDFLLVVDDTPVSTVNLPRLQSLLAYLVLHRTAPQSRSQVAFLLWPDSTEVQAHSNLRKLLHQLRQALPSADAFVQADRHHLHWRSGEESCWTLDVQEFDQAIAQAEQADEAQDRTALRKALERATTLYRGELLPTCYEEWILPERERVRHAFVWAAKRLMTLLEQERAYERAIQVAQRLLRTDPVQEETYRHLMRLFALSNDRAAALRVYHSCATVLERELATEPSEATRQVYASLLQADTAAQPKTGSLSSRSGGTALVGRTAAWRQLQTAWHTIVLGHPHIVILSGEAGIGKTRLAEEMVAWVSRQGMTTAVARCYAAGGQLPYAPVTAWLRADAIETSLSTLADVWLMEIARLVPELLTRHPHLPHSAPMNEGWQRQRFFEALAQALLSVRQPLLLMLDDLHWCDHETLQWLQYLFRFAPEARLLLLGTVRSEEALPGHPLIASLHAWQRDALVMELALGPLTTIEATSLAEQIAGHPLEEALVDDLYHETEGNPLFLVEMMRSGTFERSESMHRALETPHSLFQPASPLPSVMQSVLAARLAHLSPRARELANLAAIIGRAFSFVVLAQASGLDEETLVEGLDELWQRRIVREHEGNAYDFSHEKLREQASASLSPPRRRFLHQRVAEALVRLSAGSLESVSHQIAVHYEQAELPARAVSYYLRAGEAAQRVYAQEEALVNLQRAAALLTSPGYPPDERQWQEAASVSEHLGDVLEMRGKHQEAAEAYREALLAVAFQESLWRARLYRKLATTHDYPPHLAEALHSYQQAEHLLEGAPLPREEAWHDEWIQTQLGQLHVFFMLAQVQEMTRLIENVQPLLERYGTATQRADFFLHVAMRDAVHHRYVVSHETLSSCQMGLKASLQTGNPHLIGNARFGLGYCLFLADAFDQAEEALHAALRAGEQVGDAELIARCRLHFLPLVFRRRGQVEVVRNAMMQALAQGEKRYAGVITAHRAWVAWRDGKSEEAQAYGRTALEIWQRQRPVYPFQWTGLWPLIDLAVTSWLLALAVDYVRLLLAPTQQRQPETLLRVLEELLQAWEAGHPERVRVLFQQAISLAQDMCYL